tara:strand:+ start:110 stop:1576 length:1467 start_codon:yes stop_codon:yes gene_type:complete
MAEQLKSPISGGIRAVRNKVPASMFAAPGVTPQQVAQPQDTVTPVLVQNNTLLLGNVVRQLNVVTQQMRNLREGIDVVRSNMELQLSLDRQREAAEAKRQFEASEENYRSEGEKRIEQKTQAALITPFARIASKAQLTLGSLGKFFTTLFFGWLANKGIQAMQAMSDGNRKKLKQIGLTVAGSLLTIGALFLTSKFGIARIIGSLGKILFTTKGFALGKVFSAPFIWFGNIFRGVLGFLVSKFPWVLLGASLPQGGWTADQGYNEGGLVEGSSDETEGSSLLKEFSEKYPNSKLGQSDEKVVGITTAPPSNLDKVNDLGVLTPGGIGKEPGWMKKFMSFDWMLGAEVPLDENRQPIIPDNQKDESTVNDDIIVTDLDSFRKKYPNSQLPENFSGGDWGFGMNKTGTFDASSIEPLKKDQSSISEVISKEVETGPTIIPIPISGSSKNPLDNSGKITGESGTIPSIPALNDSNNYVYTAYREFNISPVR